MIPLSAAQPVPVRAGDGALTAVGLLLGVVTAAGQALGSLLARPAMASGVEPFAAMSVRLALAVLFFWGLGLIPRWRPAKRPFEPRLLAAAVISAFFGTALGMALLMGALKLGSVGIVSTLSSMTPVVVLPMVWIRSGKMPRPAAWIGAATAIAGIALMSLG